MPCLVAQVNLESWPHAKTLKLFRNDFFRDIAGAMVRPLSSHYSDSLAGSGKHPAWLDVDLFWSRRLQHVDRSGMCDRADSHGDNKETSRVVIFPRDNESCS